MVSSSIDRTLGFTALEIEKAAFNLTGVELITLLREAMRANVDDFIDKESITQARCVSMRTRSNTSIVLRAPIILYTISMNERYTQVR